MIKSFLSNLAPLENLIQSNMNMCEVNELMISDHTAIKGTFDKLTATSDKQLKDIINKIKDFSTFTFFQTDIKIMDNALQNKKESFESKWKEIDLVLKKKLEFKNHESKLFCMLEDINESLQKLKLNSCQENTHEKEMENHLQTISENIEQIKSKMEELVSSIKKGQEMFPNSSEKISSELSNLQQQRKMLDEAVFKHEENVKSFNDFLAKLEALSYCSKEMAQQLLTWATEITTSCSVADKADRIRQDIESYSGDKKAACRQMMATLNLLATKLFGHTDVRSLKDLEKETNNTFSTMDTFTDKLTSLILEINRKDEEEIRAKQIRDETLAMAISAKEEAQRAKAAAEKAEEAKIAAEQASQLQKNERSHQTQTETEAPPPRPQTPVMEEQPAVAPVFTTHIKDLVIEEGIHCILKAEVSGVPLPKITWFKDGISVDNNTDYVTKFENGICSLMIEETMKEDSANWSVRASNQAGYSESHAKLTVREIQPVEEEFAPRFLKGLNNQEATEGQSLELHCQVDGYPAPNVSWFKNGICIDKTKYYNIGGENGDCVLRIENVYLEDASEFTCRIENIHGQAFSSGKLTVKPLEPTEAPIFTVPLSNILARTGQEIQLECEVLGTPRPTVTWFKDNKAIKASSDVGISYDGCLAKLIVQEAYPNSAGKYVCKAQNIAGEATSTSTVYFRLLSPEPSDSETLEESNAQKQKPAFYVPLANKECIENEDIVLECTIVGNPEPEVIWYKENIPIKESEKNVLLFQGDSCKLVLKNVNISQCGNYQVKAVNKFGECQSSCLLNVKNAKTVAETETQTVDSLQFEKKTHSYVHSVSSKSVTRTSFVSDSGIETKTKQMTEPRFTTPIQGTITEEGTEIVMTAILSGYPEPKIVWLKNNQIIQPSSDMIIKSNKCKSTLTIRKVRLNSINKLRLRLCQPQCEF